MSKNIVFVVNSVLKQQWDAGTCVNLYVASEIVQTKDDESAKNS